MADAAAFNTLSEKVTNLIATTDRDFEIYDIKVFDNNEMTDPRQWIGMFYYDLANSQN